MQQSFTPFQKGLLNREEKSKEDLLPLLFPYERVNLNPGTLGSQSISTIQAMSEFYGDERAAYPLGQYQMGREHLKELRKLATRVWGHPEDNVAITSATTATTNGLASALYSALVAKLGKPGPFTVMTTHHEHYGATYGFEHHAGFRLKHFQDIELEDPMLFRRTVVREQPEIVLISQITCDLGRLYPLEDLASTLFDLPGRPIFIADAAQSLGIYPKIPLVGGKTAIDLVVSSAHKWLCGPPGSGVTFMTEQLADLIKPYFCTAHALDEDARLGHYEASGGQDFAKLAALRAGIELYAWFGPDEVLKRSQKLAYHFYAKVKPILDEAKIYAIYYGPNGRLPAPDKMDASQMLGTLVIDFPLWDPYALYDFLNANRIHAKCVKGDNPSGGKYNLIRFGFPYYETTERLDEVVEWIAGFLKRA